MGALPQPRNAPFILLFDGLKTLIKSMSCSSPHETANNKKTIKTRGSKMTQNNGGEDETLTTGLLESLEKCI